MAIMNLGYSITNVAFPILLVQRYGVGGELARTLMLRLLPMMIAGGTSAWLLRHADARIVAGVSMVLGGLVTIYASPALFVLRSGVIDNENVVKGERRSSLAPHSLALRSY